MADELIGIIDEKGHVIKQAMKTEAHKHGWMHKTVIGCVRKNGRILMVEQASDRQDAGQLVNPVGGHVAAGESEDEAFLRECEEEIGTRNVEFKLLGRSLFHRHVIGRDEKHLFIVYELTTDDELVLNHEAVSVESFSEDEFRDALEKEPERFGDALYFVLEKFYTHLLPSSWTNKWD